MLAEQAKKPSAPGRTFSFCTSTLSAGFRLISLTVASTEATFLSVAGSSSLLRDEKKTSVRWLEDHADTSAVRNYLAVKSRSTAHPS